MQNIAEFNEEQLMKFIKHDMLVQLYKNPLLTEKKEEIASMYQYFYNHDISGAALTGALLVINDQKIESLFSRVAFDVTQSMGLNVFTNPDLKTKDLSEVLIHAVDCSHSSALGKIKNIKSMPDTTVLATFHTIDKASAEVLNQLIDLNSKNPSNIFAGFETKDLDFKNEQLAITSFKLDNKSVIKKTKNSM